MIKIKDALRVSLGYLVAALCLGVWELTTLSSASPYFPPLHEIARRFGDLWLFDRVPVDLVPSLERMFLGYFAGVLAGVLLGVAIGITRRFRMAAIPIVDFVRSLPPTALIPFVIVVFGIGSPGKVVLIAFACAWPVALNSISAVANIDQGWTDTARAYRVGRRRYFQRVLLPGILPPVLSGGRVSLAIALIMVVVTEMVGSTDGLGHFIVETERTFAITDMWTGVVLIGILGYILNALYVAMEQRLLRSYGVSSN